MTVSLLIPSSGASTSGADPAPPAPAPAAPVSRYTQRNRCGGLLMLLHLIRLRLVFSPGSVDCLSSSFFGIFCFLCLILLQIVKLHRSSDNTYFLFFFHDHVMNWSESPRQLWGSFTMAWSSAIISWGQEFTLCSDHAPLQWLHHMKDITRWVSGLSTKWWTPVSACSNWPGETS